MDPIIEHVATRTARRWSRKVWWADFDDLAQEARLTAWLALPNWDPRVGVPVDAYLRRACSIMLARWCWHESSPVSGGSRRPREEKIETRATLHELPKRHAEPAFDCVDEETWRARVRQRLITLAKDEADLRSIHVLLGVHPKRVARTFRIPIEPLHRDVARFRYRITRDQTLRALLRDRME